MNEKFPRKIIVNIVITISIALWSSVFTTSCMPTQLPESTNVPAPVSANSSLPASSKLSLPLAEYQTEANDILTTLDFADYLGSTLKEAVKPLKEGDTSGFPALERIAISYAKEWENALIKWDSIIPPQECVDFHNCLLNIIVEQEQLARSLVNAVTIRNVEKVLNIVSVIGNSELSQECEGLMKNTSEMCCGKQLVTTSSSSEPAPIPAPMPSQVPAPVDTPTPALEPTPASTPSPQPLQKEYFLITVSSTRQITLTNNSNATVQVYKSSIEYELYSFIQYNVPGKPNPYYGPIVRSTITSDESVELQPGRSFFKTINRKDVVSIRSCSFYIRANGQSITITYGK